MNCSFFCITFPVKDYFSLLSPSLFLLAFCCSFVSPCFFCPNVDVPLDGLLCLVCMVKVPTTAPMLSPWKPAFPNNPESISPLCIHDLVSLPLRLDLASQLRIFAGTFAPVVSSLWSQICHWGTTLFFELILISFSKHTYTSCSCATPSVLCLILISQPFTLIPAPCSPHALLLL